MQKKTFQKAFKDSLPVFAGYLCLGAGFGILLYDAGYSIWWALLMSLTIYGGAMQYVGVDLLSSGASLIATALMTVMINARYFFYSLSSLKRYAKVGKAKPYLIFSLTDETFSLINRPDATDGVDAKRYYLYLSALDQSYWILGGICGMVLGRLLPIDTAGVEFVMTALFVTIFIDQWKQTKQHLPALLGVGISLLFLLVLGADAFVIPAMVALTVILALSRKRLEKDEVKKQ